MQMDPYAVQLNTRSDSAAATAIVWPRPLPLPLCHSTRVAFDCTAPSRLLLTRTHSHFISTPPLSLSLGLSLLPLSLRHVFVVRRRGHVRARHRLQLLLGVFQNNIKDHSGQERDGTMWRMDTQTTGCRKATMAARWLTQYRSCCLLCLSASCSFPLFQLIDYFLVFALATGVIQFLYMLLVGQFPFNSFLAGFLGAVGFFVFTGQWDLP